MCNYKVGKNNKLSNRFHCLNSLILFEWLDKEKQLLNFCVERKYSRLRAPNRKIPGFLFFSINYIEI